MQVVYDNDCNPYIDDNAEYQSLKANLSDRRGALHDILKRVFTKYDTKDHDSELIMRVPHLIAQLGIRGEEILASQAPDLLSFYQKVVIPDMRRKIDVMKEREFLIESRDEKLDALFQHGEKVTSNQSGASPLQHQSLLLQAKPKVGDASGSHAASI